MHMLAQSVAFQETQCAERRLYDGIKPSPSPALRLRKNAALRPPFESPLRLLYALTKYAAKKLRKRLIRGDKKQSGFS